MRQACGYGRPLYDMPCGRYALGRMRYAGARTHCPGCGATKQVNTWTDTEREQAEIAPDLARSAVHFHPDVKKRSIAVEVRDISPNRSRARLTITGTLYGLSMEKTCTVELVWHKEQCDRCNRITGSYYEGIVQVRADQRDLSPFELQSAAAIATQIEDTPYCRGRTPLVYLRYDREQGRP